VVKVTGELQLKKIRKILKMKLPTLFYEYENVFFFFPPFSNLKLTMQAESLREDQYFISLRPTELWKQGRTLINNVSGRTIHYRQGL
jgi:hypothetical protein